MVASRGSDVATRRAGQRAPSRATAPVRRQRPSAKRGLTWLQVAEPRRGPGPGQWRNGRKVLPALARLWLNAQREAHGRARAPRQRGAQGLCLAWGVGCLKGPLLCGRTGVVFVTFTGRASASLVRDSAESKRRADVRAKAVRACAKRTRGIRGIPPCSFPPPSLLAHRSPSGARKPPPWRARRPQPPRVAQPRASVTPHASAS